LGTERKASDIILDFEAVQKRMEKRQIQMDQNVKMILNKLNLSNSNVTSTPLVTAKPVIRPMEASVNSGVLSPVATPTIEDVTFPKADAPIDRMRKSVVEQRIVYPDGRPVILANVKVVEAEIITNIIAKVKTDSHGKWHAQLYGGKYIVEVIKGPTAAKRGFKIEYEIEIPGDGQPSSLERKIAE